MPYERKSEIFNYSFLEIEILKVGQRKKIGF